jgi:hypothetical protein
MKMQTFVSEWYLKVIVIYYCHVSSCPCCSGLALDKEISDEESRLHFLYIQRLEL